jgi:hypothetical protein
MEPIMIDTTVRTIRRPQPMSPVPAATIVRRPQDTSLFRGWGVTL